MIIEQHYDEEVLIALLDEQKESAARDPHIASCTTCTSALDSIRQVTTALHDDAVWEPRELSEEPKPETRDALRVFAAAAASEDAIAEPRVKALLAKSREEWQPLIDDHPEWRTAGFVRRLIAAVDAINFTSPTDAVELTRITVDVAEALPGDSERLRKLRAGAWREYAYALYYVGSFGPSLAAIEKCEVSLSSVTVADFDFARVRLLKAMVFIWTEKVAEGIVLTRSAKIVFDEFGDVRRSLLCKQTEAALLMSAQRHREALAVHLALVADTRVDSTMRACALHSAALCAREVGDLVAAKAYFARALADYERLNLTSFRAKARWNFAEILIAESRFNEGLALLHEVREEIEQLGMAHSAALVCLDSAAAHLLAGIPGPVSELCKSAMEYFHNADLEFSQGALTALAYLREAALQSRLTVQQVRDVRSYIEVLPKQPHLLFVRPA